MAFTSVIPPSSSRSPRPDRRSLQALLDGIHTNLSLTTILLLGASIQTILFVLPISKLYSITPAVTLLLIRLINTILITYGIVPNPYLQGIPSKKTTVQLPDLNGNFGRPGSEKIAVLLLGAKSNHPLGIFAPDFKTVGGYLQKMTKELENDPTQDSGFLGQSGFTRKAENGANEFVMVSYWGSLEDVHRYAHGPTHRDAWKWWEKTIKSHSYIGFMHEVYEADKGMWEGVYINFQPTLVGATTILKKDGKLVGGEVDDEWISPLLEAKGQLRTSNGRRGVKDRKEVVETMFKDNVYAS